MSAKPWGRCSCRNCVSSSISLMMAFETLLASRTYAGCSGIRLLGKTLKGLPWFVVWRTWERVISVMKTFDAQSRQSSSARTYLRLKRPSSDELNVFLLESIYYFHYTSFFRPTRSHDGEIVLGVQYDSSFRVYLFVQYQVAVKPHRKVDRTLISQQDAVD